METILEVEIYWWHDPIACWEEASAKVPDFATKARNTLELQKDNWNLLSKQHCHSRISTMLPVPKRKHR